MRSQADEQGRHAAGNVRGGEEEALHAAALAQRDPTREGERGVGPRAGLAGAEEEADDEQAGVVPGAGGGHGECRPPDDDAREHAARADFLAPPRADDFESGIGDGEGAEDEAHLELGEIEVAGDLGGEGGDADSIEIGYGGEEEEKAACLETSAGGFHHRRVGVYHVRGQRVQRGDAESAEISAEKTSE